MNTAPRWPATGAFVYLARMPSPVFTVLTAPHTPSKSPRHQRASPVGASPKAEAARLASRDAHARSRGREITVAKPSEAADSLPEDADVEIDDLAATVVRKTQRLLASGKVTPTLRDGLTAQQLLDRRAEKAADRRFMLNLALAMAGGSVSAPQHLLPAPQEDVIEGDFTDMDLAPAHLRAE